MDAHDELFYRLNDPDPHTQVMAELDLLHKIFGGNFVERWLEWNADGMLWRRRSMSASTGRAGRREATAPLLRRPSPSHDA